MKRRLDMLALVAVVAMTVGGFAAPGALAATGHFTAESYPAELIGEQGPTHVFKDASGYEVTCLQVFFKGTLTAKSEVLTLAPEYSGCHAVVSGFKVPATVTENGCKIALNGTTKRMDLTCPIGSKFEIHTYAGKVQHENLEPLCTYTFGEQKALPGLEYENKGTGTTRDLSIEAKIAGLAYTRHGFGICGSQNSTGTYTGISTLQAWSGLKQIGLDIG